MSTILVKGSVHRGYSIMYYISVSSSWQNYHLCDLNEAFEVMVLISK